MRTLLLTCLPLFCFHTLCLSDSHAIYLSVTSLEIKEDGMVIGKIRVFSDDLEDAIQNFTGKREKIQEREKFVDVFPTLQNYFTKNLQVRPSAGKKLPLKVTDVKNVGDSTWIEFELGTMDTTHQLVVVSKVFTELFPDQVNIVELTVNSEKTFLKLSRDQSKGVVTF